MNSLYEVHTCTYQLLRFQRLGSQVERRGADISNKQPPQPQLYHVIIPSLLEASLPPSSHRTVDECSIVTAPRPYSPPCSLSLSLQRRPPPSTSTRPSTRTIAIVAPPARTYCGARSCFHLPIILLRDLPYRSAVLVPLLADAPQIKTTLRERGPSTPTNISQPALHPISSLQHVLSRASALQVGPTGPCLARRQSREEAFQESSPSG